MANQEETIQVFGTILCEVYRMIALKPDDSLSQTEHEVVDMLRDCVKEGGFEFVLNIELGADPHFDDKEIVIEPPDGSDYLEPIAGVTVGLARV